MADTNKNDGGPAYPVPDVRDEYGNGIYEGGRGMSFRDWLAGQALEGMLAHSTRYRPREGAPSNWHEAISEEAYQIADAMLSERSK